MFSRLEPDYLTPDSRWQFYHNELYMREVTPVDAAGSEIGFTVAVAAVGATTDAKVTGDTAGTLSAKLRGLATVLGDNADAKVTDDTAGSLSAKVRGLSYLQVTLINNLSSFSVGTSTDAAVSGDTAGTLHAKLRGVNTGIGATADAGVTGDTAGSLSAKLRGVNTELGATADVAVTGDTAGSVAAKLRGLNKSLAAGLNVGGYSKIVTASLTRPNDTNAYTAGDQVADSTSAPTILTFANVGRTSGGSGVIVGATLIDHSNQATSPDLELWILNTTATPNNDNAAFAPSDGVVDTCIGVIHFTTGYAGDSATSGNKFYDAGPLSVPYVCTTTSLFGLLVVRNAYTPTALEGFNVALRVLQD